MAKPFMPDAREIFFEMHQDMPRQGPGDDASTTRALAMAADLKPAPRILDIGCGPGAQTLTLARLTSGPITAVDLYGPYLKDLAQRFASAGMADRVETVRASMADLPFAPGSFDLIWSEGAIYIMGFEAGLAHWTPLLAPGGYLAVTEACFLSDNPPAEVTDFWRAYPDMQHPAERRRQIAAAGLDLVGEFPIPDEAWWANYYTPMQARIAAVRAKYAGDPEVAAHLAGHIREIELRRRFGAHYGYVFFVMCKQGN